MAIETKQSKEVEKVGGASAPPKVRSQARMLETAQTVRKRGRLSTEEMEAAEKALAALAMLGQGFAASTLLRINANSRTEHGSTLLMEAVLTGHAELAKLLIDSGADIDARAANGSTALMDAAINCDGSCVNLLISKGADVNAKDREGYTALMFAAQFGFDSAVRLLIEAGADVNARNNLGQTALDIGSGHTETERLLRDSGATE